MDNFEPAPEVNEEPVELEKEEDVLIHLLPCTKSKWPRIFVYREQSRADQDRSSGFC